MRATKELEESAHADDFFAWSQNQAGLIRRLTPSSGGVPDGLDIANVAEEIEDLGRAELNAAESLIRNILVHLLKAHSDPQAPALAHWRTETTTFYADLVQTYSPSIRQRIDLPKAWQLAQRIARDSLRERDRELSAAVPPACPFSVDELVSDDFDFDRAVQRLADQAGALPSR